MSTPKTPNTKPDDPVYTVAELAENSTAIFGGDVLPEVVFAAFSLAGLKEATVAKAKEVTSRYLKKEVY